MRRTQMYLDEDLHRRLREMAAAEGRSAAAVVRDAVARYLAAGEPPAPNDPFLEIAGTLGTGGPTDGASEHDRYIYDDPHR